MQKEKFEKGKNEKIKSNQKIWKYIGNWFSNIASTFMFYTPENFQTLHLLFAIFLVNIIDSTKKMIYINGKQKEWWKEIALRPCSLNLNQ